MQIAIAGAGIAGLACAIFLSRAGHQVEIFDQFDQPEPVGSGLMLQETGLVVLQSLGLRDTAETLGSPVRRLFGKAQPSGRIVLDVRFSALRKDLLAVGIQRAALFNMLYDAAEKTGVGFSGGLAIRSADPLSATLEMESGQQVGSFDLVIDALGANSPLSESPRQDLPFGALWATIDWPDAAPFIDDALEQRYRSAAQMTGVMPSGRLNASGRETATYFWSIESGSYEAWANGSIAAWRDEASALWPATAEIVSELDQDTLTFARYRHRTLGTPINGRIAHIGDSWHATSPQLGQGANMALLDAFGLAKALEAHPNDLAMALKTYRDLRAWPVRLYQTMSYLFTPVYQSKSAWLPVLRDWIAAPASRVPPAPALLAAMVSGAIGRPLKRLGLVS